MADFLALDPASVYAIALGSDSRLTGARDLLEELNAAAERVAPEALVRMVTGSAARLLRLSDAGDLRPGNPADFIVVPPRGSDSGSSLVGLDRRGVRLVVIGIAAGLAVSAIVTTTMTRFLVLVSATDPAAFTAGTLVLAAIALCACYLPARRAMRIEPMAALRHE